MNRQPQSWLPRKVGSSLRYGMRTFLVMINLKWKRKVTIIEISGPTWNSVPLTLGSSVILICNGSEDCPHNDAAPGNYIQHIERGKTSINIANVFV